MPRSRPFAASDLPPDAPADGGDFALPGVVGRSVVRLLGEALSEGQATLETVLRSAVTRRLEAGSFQATTANPLFTADERTTLIEALTRTTTAAELLGRLRVLRTAQAIRERGREAFAADPLADLTRLPRTASDALRYFLGLAPMLGIDPIRDGTLFERHAFTLAAATEETLLGKVQKALGNYLRTNWNSPQSSDKPRGPEIIQAVLDQCGVTPRSPAYAQLVFRTNVIDSFNSGLTRQMSTPEMQEDFPAWEYLGIDDGRAGDDHRPHFGKLYPSSVPFAAVRGPRVFNCLPPGQYVQGRATKALKAFYSGEIIEIHTASGHRLSITPNHPVLTENGFVAAGDLAKGTHLLSYRREHEVVILSKDDEYAPLPIENVFESLAILFGGPRSAPITAFDLHSDASRCNGEIKVVGPDVELRDGFQPNRRHCCGKPVLAGRGVRDSCEPCGRSLRLDIGGVLHAASCGVCGRDLPLSALGGSRFSPLRIGAASQFDFCRGQPSHDGWATDTEFVGKLIGRGEGQVSLDQIVRIYRADFSGHVYDLETDVGYYIAGSTIHGGIVISNCRCTARPVHVTELDELRAKGVRVESR